VLDLHWVAFLDWLLIWLPGDAPRQGSALGWKRHVQRSCTTVHILGSWTGQQIEKGIPIDKGCRNTLGRLLQRLRGA
jgi:hypothetical protein